MKLTTLTKHGHACVRLEKDGSTLVIDPGGLTEESAVEGADAVLITHEHFDHLEVKRLAALASGVQIWTCAAVAAQLEGLSVKVNVVGEGDAFTAAGFEIGVAGREHAKVWPEMPLVQNVGFLIDGEVFHPGDAFTVPGSPVGTLLTPTGGPWMKAAEMLDYLKAVNPTRAFSIHDGLYNEVGLSLVDGLLDRSAQAQGGDFRRLKPGESVVIGG
ncbi:MBL fold metallo-hydrolase [Sphaerisporangium krabiense]|uniref:L-ascorbate metabolism protein UlaG (Beta-lactamase superfamily) n=1 Tax=Sphaerisporangium krabiense TaxID=763782 RepID=A0A7W8Z5G4_9ACTN|nr:MBL fold metallo-hydrolase [Sphaerisporangium krabiense]MBB5627784.1 L-ascorbate metabolism protein UlaG (beta-lactamase superfamily) [Sphaerisporangium krabiense]GII61943.1 MBL fold metallo-hydrolase [Sphaerisporangium krabiense]